MIEVSIEFGRVQTFLFVVPHLRPMVGGNVLLGETLRRDLVGLAKRHAACSLTVVGGATGDPLDPLGPKEDDPTALYRDGILSRDGGHFRASFATDAEAGKGATSFVDEARRLLSRQLPGLRFEVKRRDLDDTPRAAPQKEEHAVSVVDLPLFQVCKASGHGIASEPKGNAGAPTEDKVPVSEAVALRWEKGTARSRGETKDLIGLLEGVRGKVGLPRQELQRPVDLNHLCRPAISP